MGFRIICLTLSLHGIAINFESAYVSMNNSAHDPSTVVDPTQAIVQLAYNPYIIKSGPVPLVNRFIICSCVLSGVVCGHLKPYF